jgi:hypothetical protein
MKKLTFKIDIDAKPKKVWDTMIDPVTYKEWTNVSWPDSYFEGEWKQGANLKFLSNEGGGTLANIVEFKPYEFILAKHIAVINNDRTEDRDSDTAKGWIGTLESYRFTEKNGKTKLSTEMNINPEWESMFADSWPKAMAKLKEVCER